jgi:hypothetical protein
MTFKTEREIMKIADHIEALAFKMVAPNAYTPMFVSLANEIRTAIHTRLAQPEQEPVAWMTRFDDPVRGSYGKPADLHLKRDEADRQVHRHIEKRLCKLRVEPIYGAPQPTAQREWQGLTDEEISAISKSIPGETVIGAAKRLFAREIEAKLKEKNT